MRVGVWSLLATALVVGCGGDELDPGKPAATTTGTSSASASATSSSTTSTTGTVPATGTVTNSNSGGTQTFTGGVGMSSSSAVGGTTSSAVSSASGGTGTDAGTSMTTTSTSGAGGTGGTAAGGSGGTGSVTVPSLPPISDYSDEGPFTTTMDQGVGPNNGYIVFRPDPLGEDGFLHAPIIFGPGIGQQATVHTQMLTNFASHGFVVVATPVLNGGPGDAGNRMTMQNGLDWILEQNEAPGIYQGKLYVDHAISMGFSVGGTSAVEIGGHEAVATVVSIHGHTATASLHGPMLQTTGTEDNVGEPLQQATYDMSEVQTFLATLTGAPHQYIESNGGGDERPAIVAWMRYWIYNDMGASNYFFGDDCVLCMAPWENPQRKNWP